MIRAASLPASAGWGWVRDGFRLLRRQPLLIPAAVSLNLMALLVPVLLLPRSLGPLGPIVTSAIAPVLAIGVMHVVRAVDRGARADIRLIAGALRDDEGTAWKRLLILGLAQGVATTLAIALASLFDDGTLAKVFSGEVARDDPELASGRWAFPLVAQLLSMAPVQVLFWFAPFFVAWHRVPIVRALFFSAVCVLRNLAAFGTYALGWIVSLALLLFLGTFAQILLGQVGILVAVAAWSVGVSALYASFWSTYRDVVEAASP